MEQTIRESVEFIFINDASTDDSLIRLRTILSEYPLRATQVIVKDCPTHRGVAAARTLGLQQSHGEYVGWCDADDWADPTMFQNMIDTARATDADIVVCDCQVHYADHVETVSRQYHSNPREHIRLLYQQPDTNLMLWDKIIRRSILEKYHILPTPGVDIGEDRSILVPLFCQSSILVKVERALYHHMLDNPDSLVSSHDKSSRYRLEQDVANTDDVCSYLEGQDSQSFNLTCQYFRFLTKSGFDRVLGATREHFELYRCSHPFILRFTGLPLGLRIKLSILYSHYWVYRIYHDFYYRLFPSVS